MGGKTEYDIQTTLDYLKIPDEEIENLSEVILVLGRYWLDFSEKKYVDVEKNKSLRLKGLSHIFWF